MKRIVSAVFATALLTVALAVPAAATDGDNQHNLDCTGFGKDIGLKLYQADGQSGVGRPVMCRNEDGDWAGVSYYLIGWDGHIGNRNGGESGSDSYSGENTNHEGIWDFNNKAQSAKLVVERHAFSTLFANVCFYNNQSGSGYLANKRFTVQPGSGDYKPDVSIPEVDDGLTTSVIYGVSTNYSAVSCAEMKDRGPEW